VGNGLLVGHLLKNAMEKTMTATGKSTKTGPTKAAFAGRVSAFVIGQGSSLAKRTEVVWSVTYSLENRAPKCAMPKTTTVMVRTMKI
jgi:hypothetical protein